MKMEPKTGETPIKRKSSKTSMKARSKAHLEAIGYAVTDVEQKVKFLGQTILRDAYGFGDLLFCGHGHIGLCQSTSSPNMIKRIQKILDIPEAEKWLKAGGLILVHGWQKEEDLCSRRKVWTVTSQFIELEISSPCTTMPAPLQTPERAV